MSNYFQNFPQVDYKFGDETTFTRFQHLGTAVDILEQVRKYDVYYQTYEIQNGERPEQLSYKLYDNVNYYWTFYLLNDHLRTGGWPLPDFDVWQKAQQYYPNTVISTSAVVQEKVPKLIDTGSDILIEYVPTEKQKPLCTSEWVRVGNWVWFKNSKTAGKILKVDQKTGYVTTDAQGVREAGVELSMEVIEEDEALMVIENPDYIPVKRHEEIQIMDDGVMPEYDAPHHFEDAEGNWIWPEYHDEYPHPLKNFKFVDIDIDRQGGYDTKPEPEAPYPDPNDPSKKGWTAVSSDINSINSISNYQRIRELNVKQRTISVIKRDTIRQVVREFDSLLKQR